MRPGMRQRRGGGIVFFAAVTLLFYAPSLKADAELKETTPSFRQKLREAVTVEPEEEKFLLEWDSYVRYMPGHSLKGAAGKISITDSATELSYSFKASGRLPIELSLNAQNINIDDKEVTLSLPTHLTGLGFGIQGTFPTFIKDNLYLRLKVTPSFLSEDWNVRSSDFRLPAQAYLIYQPDKKWIFIAGLAFFPETENPVLPIAGFIYKPNAKLEFSIVPSTPSITYKLNDRISLFLDGSMSGAEFQVTKDGDKGAVLQYKEMHLGAGLGINFGRNINIYLSSGYMFNRSLKYRDSLGKASIKNTVYAEVRVEARI